MADVEGANPERDPAVVGVCVRTIRHGDAVTRTDLLAVEEPLEIRLSQQTDGKQTHHTVSVTMRTPGHDAELAVGFLFAEGILTDRSQVAGVQVVPGNGVRIKLGPGVALDLARLERHFATASACGVCGKAAWAAVRVHPRWRLEPGTPSVDPAVIQRLPETLRRAQAVFDRTGGLHASALFTPQGELLCLREDVGRHNALDKVLGVQFLAGRTPLTDTLLLVSGRVSFELVQKALVAGIPVLAAVGAPSSLAVSLAVEHGLTLIGFLRPERFNVYAGPERLADAPRPDSSRLCT